MTAPATARRTALLAFALTLVVLLANGRAIGSGDTTAVERTAAALADHGSVLLGDSVGADPFTRVTPRGRVSIYPALPALLATPVFLVFRVFFDLDLFGAQIAGKVAAALLSAMATGLLAFSFARRGVSPSRALAAALVFGLGTSVSSTSQALWQHPAAILFLVLALLGLEALEASNRAGVPSANSARVPGLVALSLTLVAACRPAAIPMVAVLLAALVIRLKARALAPLAAGALPAVLVGAYNAWFFGAPWRFGPQTDGRFFAALPDSIPGLLVSPARGLLVFTPIALLAVVGLARRAPGSWLARTLMAAVAAHFVFIACWNEWHGGESFGPRLLTDCLPALFFFLPEGLAWAPRFGAVLGAASVAIQLLGSWTYDYRWERLHQRGGDFDAALWSWREAPVAFALREGVVAQGRPAMEGRKLRLRVRRFVPFGPEGAVIEGGAESLRISGSQLVRDIRLERGARVAVDGMALAHPADALAFRASSAGSFTLRLTGSLRGAIRVESDSGVVSTPTDGAFDVTVPLELAAGGDVFIRAESGDLRLARVGVEPRRY